MVGLRSNAARTAGAAAMICLALTGTALAAPKANQIGVSVNALEDKFGISENYLYAISGDLATDGALIRLGVGYGGGDEDDGARLSADVLLGYQIVVGNWKMRIFAGPTMVQDADSPLGYKILGQVQNKKTDDIYVNATAGYSSPKEQVNGTVQVGFQVAGLVAGPEVGVVATPDFTRTRIGAFLTGMKIGDVGLTVHGGYTHYESDTESRDSAYAGASATLQY
jgi:hypothetical protein